MQQATTVSLQMGFSGPPEGTPTSPKPIEIKEETVEGLGGFEPPTCGLGNRSASLAQTQRLVAGRRKKADRPACWRQYDNNDQSLSGKAYVVSVVWE